MCGIQGGFSIENSKLNLWGRATGPPEHLYVSEWFPVFFRKYAWQTQDLFTRASSCWVRVPTLTVLKQVEIHTFCTGQWKRDGDASSCLVSPMVSFGSRSFLTTPDEGHPEHISLRIDRMLCVQMSFHLVCLKQIWGSRIHACAPTRLEWTRVFVTDKLFFVPAAFRRAAGTVQSWQSCPECVQMFFCENDVGGGGEKQTKWLDQKAMNQWNKQSPPNTHNSKWTEVLYFPTGPENSTVQFILIHKGVGSMNHCFGKSNHLVHSPHLTNQN